jgi:hypothetical protein
MELYIPKAVEEIREFYGELLENQASFTTISAHLEALAIRMCEGVRTGTESVFREISNFHQDHLGRSLEVIAGLGLNEEDCRQAIANEYGFGKWSEVKQLLTPYDMNFEQTVNALLTGNPGQVKECIGRKPALLNQCSKYGHKATLLHYAVSNGVEFWRQQVPLNLPEMVSYLLEKGADRGAKMKVYGGEYTAAELLLSSLHPGNAGIFEELRMLLDT